MRPLGSWKTRPRAVAMAVALLLVAWALSAVPAATAGAAAPVRYEAESATITQGAVESDHTGFSGTGFVNGDNVTGSSVEWTVNAASAGPATIALRYSNGTAVNRPMDITVNGTVASAAREFAATANWDTWATSTFTATLNAGANKIRATATTANGGPNLDYVEVESAGAPSSDYQAESAKITQGAVESNHAGYTGTGFVNYDNVTGSSVEFTVNAASAGPASLDFRYANGTTTDRPMSIAVNGTAVAGSLSFPGTTDWTTWQEIKVNATLKAGANTVTATSTTANGGPNLDRLRVGAPSDTEQPSVPGQPVCDAADITENSIKLSWPTSTDNVGVVAYDIFNLGQKLAEAPNPPGSPHTITGLSPNTTYTISVFARDAAGNVSQSSPEVTCKTKAGENQPPSAPGGLTASGVGSTNVSLSWSASTDNVGVTSYVIRNDDNNAVIDQVSGNPPATSRNVTVLACDTAYRLHVVAKDAAGNTSPKSNVVSFSTSGCGNTPSTPAQVSTGWDVPWDISWAPDGSFGLVTERDTFKVFKINKDGSGKTQVGTVPNAQTTGGEGGLMGVAFSPTWNGSGDREVFFMHTASEGNRIAKMNFDGSALSGYTAIVTGIKKNRYHNGGRIRFGPDGYLYATCGEAQTPDLAQDKNSLNGKILRVTKSGDPAPGNPSGTRIYSYGHRNPQGLAWDSAGRLWESELGDSTADEINLIQPGKNYGWPTCEGTCGTSGMTNPKKTWPVAQASPSGLAYVNGALFMAALRGQRMWRIVLNGENVTSANSYWNGTYGRLRAVVKVPGANAIWFGTTNSDNNGDGTADRIFRSNVG
ncbi:PQQ-dependent sugar dehydrogenase [Actinomadura barringtoniae]|uniref:PQQ-dependent sugar dehydrogenase n=1 Tax=Actinomadura barringtoniae TaxID=1427535 RepID=A0A939T5W4_9ACTN|nr:PQQ-dependent sugar dehydrogenase [Actinomadura barringtoniae]MBO2447577.1 PQQ-dependent sugar dehydrogenase [Actinomadura barringtoniae]